LHRKARKLDQWRFADRARNVPVNHGGLPLSACFAWFIRAMIDDLDTLKRHQPLLDHLFDVRNILFRFDRLDHHGAFLTA
jgi:hypothetical protein